MCYVRARPVVAQSRIDYARQNKIQINWALSPFYVQEFSQLFEVYARIFEPIIVFNCTNLKSATISKEIDHIHEPAIFAERQIEVVAFFEGASDVSWITQAEHNFWRQFEIVEDLMP